MAGLFPKGSQKPWAAFTLLIQLLYGSSMIVFVAGQTNVTKVKGGYYAAGSSHLLPSSILNATFYTHLFYAFAYLDSSTYSVKADANDVPELTFFSASMKMVNPDILTLISVSAGSDEFAAVLQSNASRVAFINSSISLARSFDLDGIDLDWEFPQSEGNMTSFGSFLAEWRHAVVAEAQESSRAPLLLTAAVYFSSTILYPGKGKYPIASISENLDFVNIMCYDFHGSWDVTATGANSNLYDPDSILSANYGITSWLEAGLPPDKAVLGLTLYGRSWMLQDQNVNAGLGAPAVGAGPPQPRSKSSGVFYYSEVVDWIAKNNATVVHDPVEVTAYCYANNVWVSYEDPSIVSAKVVYAKSRGLRGYFFWAVSFDNNWEVSRAASQTLSYAIPDGPIDYAPAPAPSSATSATTMLLLSSAAALLLSHLLLLPSSSFV